MTTPSGLPGTLTIQPHRWEEHGRKLAADFYPFVDGKPAPELATCTKCRHFVEGGDCLPFKDPAKAATCYPFCGPVCGEFKP